jgi:hypothetical protein
MKFLDWMKDRNRLGLPKGSERDPKTYGHETWRGLQSEIESDTKLGRMRDETGREPESIPLRRPEKVPDKKQHCEPKVQQPTKSRSWER